MTALGWTSAILSLGVLLSSLFHSTNITVRLATVALTALSIWRPRDAILIAVAFAGFGDLLGLLAGEPSLRAEEAIVVASLFGWCVRGLFTGLHDAARPFRGVNIAPVALFGLTALCSMFVWMRVDQVRTVEAGTYLVNLWQCVSTEYFVRIERCVEVASLAALLESLALYLAIATMCRDDRTFAARTVRMLIVGGAALGAFSVIRITEIALRNPNAIAMLRTTAPGLRISPQIPDYIAAAAYFGLCWTTALGLALQPSRQRAFAVGASLLIVAGLFLTGSRSAIGAAAGGLFVLAYLVVRGRNAIQPRRVIGFAVVALIALALVFPRLIGHDLAGVTAGESLKVRLELWKAGVGVLGTHPLFGVGLDRFFIYLDRFASPELKAMWSGRLNPHNDFLRIATEFGLVGLSLFVWTLAGSVKRIGQGWSGSGGAPLAGLIGGLTAFLLTMCISNPLMLRPTSYVFWIALGLATGEATATANRTADDRAIARPRRWWRNAAVAAAACVIVASVPVRAAREIAGADLAGVTYGLYDWTASPNGGPSRLSGATATVFVSADARVVEFSLAGTLPSGRPQTVEAFVDGRLANEISVGRQPERLRILLAKQTGQSRRIDFRVSPTWVPADVDPSSDDHRTLGVRIGEIVVRGTAGVR